MKKTFFLLLIFIGTGSAFAEGVTGKWKTIDDETGKPKSIVEIFKDGEIFKARIESLIDPEKKDPVCEKCPDDKNGKPVVGLEIMWDMKETEPGSEWGKGRILDPKNGNVYRCRLRLKDGGEKLEVRGYLGVSLFGRSQTWTREKEPAK